MSKLFIEETTLTAIGDAIREMTGLEELIAPGNMPNEIRSIETGSNPIIEPIEITANGTYNTYEGVDGFAPITVNVPQEGAPSAEELTFTGELNYTFSYNHWNGIINKYGNLITTKDITNLMNCFNYSDKLEQIPFDLNCKINDDIMLSDAFAYCYKLKALPKILNAKVASFQNAFNSCYCLREIPADYVDTWNWDNANNASSEYSILLNSIFYNCYSLRSFPMKILENYNPHAGAYTSIYYNLFPDCYALDEVIDLPVAFKTTATSNYFSGTLYHNYRFKEFMFKPGEVASWKNQVIDLSSSIGYTSSSGKSKILNYNSGITADKEVKDAATYEALKNDPDWFSTNIAYSRYNHDSAVNTINSLPDVTSGSGNTIKFKGASGSATDGGAINTMTEEEIAVATAKGWTVTLV